MRYLEAAVLPTAGDTLPKIVRANALKWGPRTAMAMKRYGIWQRFTWQEYYENVKFFSLGLISLGFKTGDIAAIIGDN